MCRTTYRCYPNFPFHLEDIGVTGFYSLMMDNLWYFYLEFLKRALAIGSNLVDH